MKQAIFVTENDQTQTSDLYTNALVDAWLNDKYYKEAMTELPVKYPDYQWTQGKMSALDEQAYDLIALSRNIMPFQGDVARDYAPAQIIVYKPWGAK